MARPGNPLPNVSTGLLTRSRGGTLVEIHVPDSLVDTKLGKGYTLRACADYAEVVAEIAEDNNCGMATGTIEVTAAAPVPVP